VMPVLSDTESKARVMGMGWDGEIVIGKRL